MSQIEVRWLSRAAVLLVALLFGCSKSGSDNSANELAPLPLGSGGPQSLVVKLDALVGGSLSSEEMARWAEKLDADMAVVDQLIEELVEAPQLASSVIPSLLFGKYLNVKSYYAVPSGFTLSSEEVEGERIYYLREPCKRADAHEVTPWWDLETTVYVCPEAHRPDKSTIAPDEHNYRSEMPLTCDSQVGSPEKELEPICGCGPNLIRCMRDSEHYEEMRSSLVREVRESTRHVYSNDLPLTTLFTSDMSYRDRNAEIYHRRQQIGATGDSNVEEILGDIDEWPASGRWAPRAELRSGQHAGVLTAPQLLHWMPDRRQRQRMYYELLWCSGQNSFGATTQQVFEVSETANLAFVHDSWERLAHMELCTNCHARLDYGFQFFLGYPDSRASIHLLSAQMREGKGPLYGDSIHDPRGEAELNPKAFAAHSIQQPEFADCMTDHVTNYVLGDSASDEDRNAIRSVIREQDDLKSAIRLALSRYAERFGETTDGTNSSPEITHEILAAAGPLAPQPAQPTSGELVEIGTEMRDKLKKYCVGCHDDSEPDFDPTNRTIGQPFDFGGDQLPRRLVVRMADQVAFGNMPEEPITMTRAQREHLVSLMIAALWDEEDARKEAAAYYLGQLRALPAQQIDNVSQLVNAARDTWHSTDWGFLERAISSSEFTYTPNYAAITGLLALEGCVRSEAEPLESCLESRLALERLTRGRIEETDARSATTTASKPQPAP